MSDDLTLDCEDDERLTTRRLILRRPTMRDVPAITAHLADYDVVSMLSRVPWPYMTDDAEAFVAAIPQQSKNAIFALARRECDDLIGIGGLHRLRHGRAELGYWLGRAFWGSGYGTEAAQRLIDYGFQTLELDRIDVSCRVVNDASRQLIRRCGFAFTGPGMIDSLSAGRVASEHYMLDRNSWRSIRMWGR
ncbi:GNAT family N-acetyltransferase [Fulvimarina sp. 2208YS6-2-32]|uniref:GNAT family N-acetyltransferase n=1 Tax=Fulvimarina uroteuthidis TaxID=3098149 RepID=A0ABU5HZY4_9HYPH|nr:GNAT family N-acetyltransferase [Fulvimarina sp. 2208YS6-2-32]MDY8108688.1 GNAT family N-acetyltransferase [Fulvimarina sp. 2208YS6-2-32]